MIDKPNKGNNPAIEELINLFKSSKFFSKLDADACEVLFHRLEIVNLQQGEILFEQGEPSNCMYILGRGQLVAFLTTPDGKQKIVGSIERGETVGELGALSNQPRSLTIRSATDCVLLKLTQQIFEEFCNEYPQIRSRVIDLIIQRSQHALKIMSEKKLYQHIAIIKGNDDVSLEKFTRKIKENFSDDPKFILQLDVSQGDQLFDILEEAELNGKAVIFILDQNNMTDLQTKLSHIGSIYILVDGDKPGQISTFALNTLGMHHTPSAAFTKQSELVLLHDDSDKLPTGTLDWLKQTDFTLHHHIRTNNNLDYQRLIRFMMGKPIGLVLGGGGNKGWTCLGVIKALLEANIPIDFIGGTSVGALIGGLYVLTLSYEKSVDAFEKISMGSYKTFSIKNFTWPLISLLSSKKSTEILQQITGDIQMEDLWLPIFSIASDLTLGKEVVHRHGLLWKTLRASLSVPGILPPVIIDGDLCVDGGLLNNLPVDVMRQILGNDGTIIAVSLTDVKTTPIRYNFPPILPFRVVLLKKLRLRYTEYSFPPFLNTFMKALLLGSSAREKANLLAADIAIAPDLSKFATFELGKKNRDEMIEIGYQLMREQIKGNSLAPISTPGA